MSQTETCCGLSFIWVSVAQKSTMNVFFLLFGEQIVLVPNNVYINACVADSFLSKVYLVQPFEPHSLT